MKVLIVCGGQSSEHSISRISANNIYKNINKDKYEVTVAGIDKEGNWYTLKNTEDFTKDNWLENSTPVTDLFGFIKSFDVAFPVLHGLYGEDGTIQGLFELANIPYVGCRVADSACAMDKIISKKIFDDAKVPQTPSLYAYQRYDQKIVIIDNEGNEHDDVVTMIKEKLGLPVFVKASRSGSSVGCYKVSHEEDLLPKLEEAAKYDRKIVVEKAIHATELEVAVLGNDDLIISRVGQILPHGEFYTFESKYEDEQSSTCIPARITDEQAAFIRENAHKAFKAIDGHGLARVDFFLDQDTNNIYLNEVNTLPGFTPISMYPMLMRDSGIDTPELIDRLIQLAYER